MKSTRVGLLLMLLSMSLSEVVSLSFLVSTGGKLASENIASPFNIATIIVSFLEPVALLLEIIAIIIVVSDSKRLTETGIHRRLALTAGLLFVAWAILNFIVYLPLSLLGMKTGSLQLVRLALATKTIAALFQYPIPFLLVYGIASDSRIKLALWAALILTILGGLEVIITPITGVGLKQVPVQGNKFYVPRYEIDYTSWPYPVFLVLSHSGGILYMLVYAITIRKLSSIRQPYHHY